MNKDNLASYEASSFCIDARKLQFEDFRDASQKVIGKVVTREDYPALIHEWWHYIQDVSTSSAQNGFYLWLRDIMRISHVISNGEDKVFHLPFPKDEFGQSISKDRELFRIFCGEDITDNPTTAEITERPTINLQSKRYDTNEISFAVCTVKFGDKQYPFGLIALQELNAFYIQRIAESYLPETHFTKPTSEFNVYPYKVGELLFEFHNINSDDKTKFIISSLCLDSIQAPAVFLTVLERLSNKTLNYSNDRDLILNTVNEVTLDISHSNDEALNEWIKDYDLLIHSSSCTKEFRDAIQWYLSIVHDCYEAKIEYGADILPLLASRGKKEIDKLSETFPAPLVKYGNSIQTLGMPHSDIIGEDKIAQYDNALIIWMTRRVYDIVSCSKRNDLNKYSRCPLSDDCPYKDKVSNSYYCTQAVWDIVQGEKKANCPFQFALYNLGLWQNSLEIDVDSLE